VLWQDSALREISDKLVQLGLDQCRVCGSPTALGVDKRPVILPVGGVPWPTSGTPDPDANGLFMVRLECNVCGHSMLFNSERFITGDTPALKLR
jgi:hypothetical protein